MRRIGGVLIGILLFFPGAMVIQLVSKELGLYQEMTLTDALLVVIIVLASALLFGQPKARLTADELEDRAKRMELASQRLESAQRRMRSTRRTVKPAPEGRGTRTRNVRRPM